MNIEYIIAVLGQKLPHTEKGPVCKTKANMKLPIISLSKREKKSSTRSVIGEKAKLQNAKNNP